jgi:hypothetical protein
VPASSYPHQPRLPHDPASAPPPSVSLPSGGAAALRHQGLLQLARPVCRRRPSSNPLAPASEPSAPFRWLSPQVHRGDEHPRAPARPQRGRPMARLPVDARPLQGGRAGALAPSDRAAARRAPAVAAPLVRDPDQPWEGPVATGRAVRHRAAHAARRGARRAGGRVRPPRGERAVASEHRGWREDNPQQRVTARRHGRRRGHKLGMADGRQGPGEGGWRGARAGRRAWIRPSHAPHRRRARGRARAVQARSLSMRRFLRTKLVDLSGRKASSPGDGRDAPAPPPAPALPLSAAPAASPRRGASPRSANPQTPRAAALVAQAVACGRSPRSPGRSPTHLGAVPTCTSSAGSV